MTKNADFKKIVRARMAKTGESYAAARSQLLDAPPPTVDEYADLAGMTDASVQKKTDKTWLQWVQALDALDAHTLDHAAIARVVLEHWPEIGGWWAQSVTVGYERIRGIRAKGQKSTGVWSANKSKTLPVPVEQVYAAFDDDALRSRWLPTDIERRSCRPGKSFRFAFADGSTVAVHFTDKGVSKSTVTIQHDKLGSAERRDLEKAAWGERFQALASLL